MRLRFLDNSDNPIPNVGVKNENEELLYSDSNGTVNFTEGDVFTRDHNTAPPSEIAKVELDRDFETITIGHKR